MGNYNKVKKTILYLVDEGAVTMLELFLQKVDWKLINNSTKKEND